MFRSALCFSLALLVSLSVNAHTPGTDIEKRWSTPYIEAFDTKQLKHAMPLISVDKNQFVDESGNTVIFRGVNIADPDKLQREGRWSVELFSELKRWGANVVRLPVHPIAWRAVGRDEYLKLLDQAVTWANAFEIYVIIDWHSIGNLKAGVFQHPMYETDLPETLRFWQTIATRYKGTSTVAFYELFNEPTLGGGRFGKMTWKQWKSINLQMIDLIQAHDDQVVLLVGGFNWAYDLSMAKGDLIKRNNIGYVSHPYPQKEQAEPFEKAWHKHWGFVTKYAPLMATEIGWMHDGEYGAHVPVINNDDTYGPRIINYLDGINASWVAWVFDPRWTPSMIKDWDFTPTTQGAFFKDEMLKHQK